MFFVTWVIGILLVLVFCCAIEGGKDLSDAFAKDVVEEVNIPTLVLAGFGTGVLGGEECTCVDVEG